MRCLYCGKNEMVIPGNPYLEIPSKDPYKCKNCGIACSKPEVDMDGRRIRTNNFNQFALISTEEISEEAILHSAWELMQKHQWDQAITKLYTKGFPFKHTLEFIFCREICQTAVLFCQPKVKAEDRCQSINILLNNLTCLDYYLPEDDKDETFRIMQRLFQALMLLGSLPIQYPDNAVMDRTNHRRAMLLSAFADILELETIGNKKYCADYLKMGVQLLHKSLEINQEKPAKLIPYFEEQLSISTPERQQINAKLKMLNAQIKRLDPGFKALPPLPMPKVIPQYFVKLLKLTVTATGGCIVLYFCVSLGISVFSTLSLPSFDDICNIFMFIICVVISFADLFSEKKDYW